MSPWVLWSGLLLAPLGFGLQVVASYGVAAQQCLRDAEPQAGLWVLSLAALVLAGAGVLAAATAWRATRGEKRGGAHELADRGEGRTRFMGMFGLTSSALMLAAVLFLVSSLWFFGGCAGLPAG